MIGMTNNKSRWEIRISNEDLVTPYLWDNHRSDNYSLGTLCRILNEYEEQTNEVERLRNLIRKYIDFMDENLGTTADWPMEAAFDDGEVCQQHCDLLNAMKREVKPEDIN